MQVIQLKSIKNYIKHSHRQTLSGVFATFSLCLFTQLTVFPIVGVEQKTEAATGTASTTSLTLTTTGGASLDLAVNSNNGTFAETSTNSGQATFSVTTTNFTGYNLSISASDDAGTLINSGDNNPNTNYISSLPTGSALSASQFNSATYNGKWGYKPSKLNSSTNTNYLPAPTKSSPHTINITKCASGKSNGSNTCPASDNYTTDLAARLEYSQSSGNYTKTFILTATGNPITYTINYSDTTGDSSVSGIPTTPTTGSTSDTTITLSGVTPTRTGYTFAGWCDGTVTNYTNGTNGSCNGTTYPAGGEFGIDQTTTEVNTTLYAIWNPNSYTCTKQYRLQNADGTWGSYTTDSTASVKYGATCSYSKSATDYKNSESGTDNSTASTSGTMNSTNGITLQLSLYRNTYALTISAGSNTSNATGSGTYRWGESVTVGVTKATNTTCVSYATPTWTATAGTAPSAGTSVSYTMPKSNATLTATSSSSNVSQAITLGKGTGVSGITIDGTNRTDTPVSLTCGGHTISGNYDSGYEFSSWSGADGVIVADTSANSTTMTVSGPGTLTLNAKSSIPYIQDFTLSMCSAQASSSAVTVVDKRDNKEYTVRYVNGACWMTQNLAYVGDTVGSPSSTTGTMIMKSATSNISTSKTIAYYDLATDASTSSTHCYGSSDSSGKGYSNPCIKASTNSSYGTYYNYKAVSAGIISGTNSSSNATYDVCPKGWRLPIESEFSNMGSYSNKPAFSPVYSGFYDNGTLDSSYGYWWSATANGGKYRYSMYYYNGSLYIGGLSRYHGGSVRCIRTTS